MIILSEFLVPAGTRRAPLRPLQDLAIPLLVALYLLFILPVYIDNNAGPGMSMPQNVLAWGTMMLCVLVALACTLRSGQVRYGQFIAVSALGVVLLLLPWLWTSSFLWRLHALPRMAGIIGALFFALALCQVHLTHGMRRALLIVTVLSALTQSGEAMMQAWMPEVSRNLMCFSGTAVYGIFQQRNLLASWLASGAGVALYLALTARSRQRAMMWLVCLYPICAALTLTQSRTGVLGLTLTSLLVALADRKRLRGRPLAVLCRIIFLTSLLVWCFGISLWAMPSGDPVDLTHEMSNRERLLMLDGATRMVATHPLTGYGLGSFESVFPKVMVDAGLQMKSDTVTHPHNEILYVASEGGVVALAGLLILGGVWFWPLVWRLYYAPLHGMCPDTGRWLSGRKGLSSSGWLLPLTGLPVVVHIMLEYPLYLSAPHLLLLLLLFRIGLPEAGLHMCRLPACIHLFVLPLLMVVIAGILSILQAGFTTQRALSRAEAEMNQGLLPVLPSSGWQTLTQAERLELDQHMLSALTPGFLQRPEDTAAFWLWGQRWLAVHNDAEVSAAMMLIAQHRGDSASEERLRVNAARVFVNDPRFIRSGH